MSKLSYITVSRDFTFQIKGMSKFCIDNMGETSVWVGKQNDETLEIPAEASRTFETPVGDVLENEETWSIKFSKEDGTKKANLIMWNGRSKDLTERIQ